MFYIVFVWMKLAYNWNKTMGLLKLAGAQDTRPRNGTAMGKTEHLVTIY